MITIRRSAKADLDVIMCILGEARETIGRLGIDQWQYGYPTRDIVREDVIHGRSYVAEDEDGVCAVFSLIEDGEPTYQKIYCGHWMDEDLPYLALHRIAIRVNKRGSGLSGQIMQYITDKAKAEDYATIRVDTHRGNLPMRRMLEKNGFVHTGIIYLKSGEERVAYEKAVVALDLNYVETAP